MSLWASAAEVLDPQDGIDLWYAFIVGLPALVAAVASVYAVRGSREHRTLMKKQGGQILNQVENDHPTNLRDDIDSLSQVISDGFAGTRKDLHQVREEFHQLRWELAQERQERIEGDRRGLRRSLGLEE